jgi:hypothetical protein
MQGAGKALVVAGGVMMQPGLVVMFSDRIPFPGELPGDISIKKERFHVCVPLTSCLVISALLSLLFWVVPYFRDK